jgi:2-polyprenyl-6-methoxyphenol hydroxylase-like FAD-dependent oxidoreductase
VFEVIVVGAGPVGSCLALLLADRGIETVLVEQDEGVSQELRASTFHPPTLDMLAPLGLTEVLIERGLVCPTWQVRLHPSGERAVFDLALLKGETAHPFRLQCEQWKLTQALHERLAGRIEFMRGARFIGLRQTADGVEIELEQGGERRRLAGGFLVGCDGARSGVRAAAGLAFEGETYPETSILATTSFAFEDHLPGISNVSYCWKEGGGNFSLLKVPGRWRVSIYPNEDEPIESQLRPEALQAALQEIVARPGRHEIGEARPYRVHMRMASRYRLGRVALAGDAAHVNSPAGGMGMNGGLHDAFELAAALHAMLRIGADERRLDLYERRRRPVAYEEILLQADRNRARMRERDPSRRRETLAGLQATANDTVRCKAHLMRSSMIDGLRRAAEIG